MAIRHVLSDVGILSSKHLNPIMHPFPVALLTHLVEINCGHQTSHSESIIVIESPPEESRWTVNKSRFQQFVACFEAVWVPYCPHAR